MKPNKKKDTQTVQQPTSQPVVQQPVPPVQPKPAAQPQVIKVQVEAAKPTAQPVTKQAPVQAKPVPPVQATPGDAARLERIAARKAAIQASIR